MKRFASSLLISSPAISCFLTDASTKSDKSDQHFKQVFVNPLPCSGWEEELGKEAEGSRELGWSHLRDGQCFHLLICLWSL